LLKKQATNNLAYNLKDNVNSYSMNEDGSYVKREINGEPPFNIHKEFYNVSKEIISAVKLF